MTKVVLTDNQAAFRRAGKLFRLEDAQIKVFLGDWSANLSLLTSLTIETLERMYAFECHGQFTAPDDSVPEERWPVGRSRAFPVDRIVTRIYELMKTSEREWARSWCQKHGGMRRGRRPKEAHAS